MADRPYETRTVTADIELRDDSDAPVLTGYASTFNQPYQVGHFNEQIHPDAFKRTLAGSPDVRLLIDHEGQPLARTKSGTLALSTDKKGLSVRATLDPTDPDVQRLLPKMKRGDLDQMSFAFRVPQGGDDWDYTGDAPSRTIREANLQGGDVSVVTYPANENASAQLRARDERKAAWALADAMLREAEAGHEFDTERVALLSRALRDLDLDLTGRVIDKILTPDDDVRSAVSTKDVNDLPDSDFAYIEPGGEKDADGKTTPRSLRHFPIMDADHVRNALARVSSSPFGDKALPAIKAAAKKFGVDVSEENSGIPADLARRLSEIDVLRRSAA